MAEQEAAHDGADFGDFMKGLEAQVMDMMAKSYRAPKDAREAFDAFTAAINWKQPWIRGLMAFHVFNLVFLIVTRNNIDAQTGQFLLICVLVLFSERLNSWCSAHHADFADQDYFDSRGAFTGMLYSGPLLLVLLLQLINLLRVAGSALIKAKRLELADKRRREASTETKKSK
jgi:hypothetical protein